MSAKRVAVIGITLIGFVVGIGVAGPVLPRLPELTDQVKSMADLKRIRIDITPIPELVERSGTTAEQVEKTVRDRLAGAGLEVEDDAKLPRVNLTVMVAQEPDQPKAVGLAVVIMVYQNATVHRIDRKLDVPTNTVIRHVLTSRSKLADAVARETRTAVELLIDTVRSATIAKTPPATDATDTR